MLGTTPASAEFSDSHAFSCWIHTTALWGRYSYCSLSTDGETETQPGEGTCWGSWDWNLCLWEPRILIITWPCFYPPGSYLAMSTQRCTWPREECALKGWVYNVPASLMQIWLQCWCPNPALFPLPSGWCLFPGVTLIWERASPMAPPHLCLGRLRTNSPKGT